MIDKKKKALSALNRLLNLGEFSLMKNAGNGSWRNGFKKDGETIREGLGDEWQPIETAPKDGVEILGLKKNGDAHVVYGHRYGAGGREFEWAQFAGDNSYELKGLTHWMPLPQPPKEVDNDTHNQ